MTIKAGDVHIVESVARMPLMREKEEEKLEIDEFDDLHLNSSEDENSDSEEETYN